MSVETEETVDSPPQSSTYEELVEVVTHAVARLNIVWPAEKQDTRPKSKLDECFLRSRSQPSRRGLTFFPDLHAEVSRSWEKPYSSRIYSPTVANYSNIVGLNDKGYGAMPVVEQTLASYLSPSSASSLKVPKLPSRPVRLTSSLVGKAYMAAGQAGTCLHTMAVLQAYQTDLPRDLDDRGEEESDVVAELHRATDLSLRATKETARAIGCSMVAMVATERHLWLNLSEMKDKDRFFLLDAPLSPSGFFGNAVNTVVDRFQEVKKQAAAFQRFLPRRSQSHGAAEREPQPSSSSYRQSQKQSVVQKDWGSGRRSQSGSSRAKTDLQTVILSKRTSAKRS